MNDITVKTAAMNNNNMPIICKFIIPNLGKEISFDEKIYGKPARINKSNFFLFKNSKNFLDFKFFIIL